MTALLLDRPAAGAEFARIIDELTRRGFLAGGAGTAALPGLAAGGSGSQAGDTAPDAWTFTDDTGRRIHLASRPKRVAALADPLTAELWLAGLRVVAAPFNSSYGAGSNTDYIAHYTGASPAALRQVTKIGAADGSTDLEALARARPDLIVANADAGQVSIGPQASQIAKIAPVAGINTLGVPLSATLASVDRLVSALGARLADTAAKARYQAAAAKLRDALAAKPGLRVMFCFYDGGSGLNYEIAADWPVMRTLGQLGMQFAPAGANSNSDKYYTLVSWELVPSLPVDLIVYDSTGLPSANPAWNLMPAVKAGQIVEPDNDRTQLQLATYANDAAIFEQLADAVRTARRVGPAG